MENSLELFHPKKSELMEMAGKYSALTIAGIDDREWYKAVHDARMVLVKTRTGIKEERLKFTRPLDEKKRQAIELEEELIGIISPLEKSLEAKENAIDREKEEIRMKKEREKQAIFLDRIAQLAKYWYSHDLAELKEMEFANFMNLLELKKIEWETAEKARIEKEESERKEREEFERQRAEFQKEKAEQERREAEIIAKEKAIEDARLAKERAEYAERLEKEREEENARIRSEIEVKAKVEAEARIKRESEEKEAREALEIQRKKQAEKAEQEELEKKKKYKAWLENNGYDATTDKPLKSEDGKSVILWRQISTFII